MADRAVGCLRANHRSHPCGGTCASAARQGHLECLRHYHLSGEPLDEELWYCAMSSPRYRQLTQYLAASRCPIGGRTVGDALLRHGTKRAADLVEQLVSRGHPVSDADCARAVAYGNYRALRCLHQAGASIEATVILQAITPMSIHNSEAVISCIAYLRGNGCPWEGSECRAAAGLAYGCDVLEYLLANDVPIRGGEFQALRCHQRLRAARLLHEAGASWSGVECLQAIRAERISDGLVETIAYCRAHGAPWNRAAVVAAVAEMPAEGTLLNPTPPSAVQAYLDTDLEEGPWLDACGYAPCKGPMD